MKYVMLWWMMNKTDVYVDIIATLLYFGVLALLIWLSDGR